MLEHFFGSRTRVKLLTLFLHHPEEAIYVRELTRRIATQINAVRRELTNLVTVGFLCEEIAPPPEGEPKRAGVKRKYYRVNPAFPLLDELRSFITKAQIFLEWDIEERVRRLGDVRYAALLGGFLGAQREPIDFFLVGTVKESALKALIEDLQTELGFEINYACISPTDFAYRKEMADRFIDTILLSPKKVILDTLAETYR